MPPTSNITKNIITDGLRKLGIQEGCAILVHSSLSSLGYVEGGANAVIDALLEVVGENGTVVVPTLTGDSTLSCNNPPVFNIKESKGYTGTIPETFRKRPNAVRSLHPTHSVAAIGFMADYLTRDHIYSITPCDTQSPFGKLANLTNGYILLIGVNHSSNTMLHYVEEIVGVEYHIQPGIVKATIIENGVKRHSNLMIHKYGPLRDFNVIEPLLVERGAQVNGTIGASEVKLISAPKMVNIVYKCLMADKNILLAKEQR